MNPDLYHDEIERILDERTVGVYERQNARRHLRRLISKAQPGNIPYRILENDFGFQGDYQEADWGEPPRGAN